MKSKAHISGVIGIGFEIIKEITKYLFKTVLSFCLQHN